MINGILTLTTAARSPSLPQTARTPVPAASRARTARATAAERLGPTIDKWFDTSVFAETAPFTYGNCGFNSVRGRGRRR